MQWSILRRAFHGHTTLVLIGDPKQAIYAFRGADVVSYLEATRRPTRHATLAINWRSDAPLLAALEQVFGGRRARRRADRRAPGGGGAGRSTAGRRAVRCAGARPGRVPRGACPPRRGVTCRSSRPRAIWSSPIWRPTWRACSAARRRSTAWRCSRATSPCWCAPTSRAGTVRGALAAVGVPAVRHGHGERLRRPRRGASGSRCWRRSSSPGWPGCGPPRSPASSVAPSRSCAGLRRRCPARRAGRHRAGLGRGAARARGGGAAGGGHHRHRPARAACSPAPTASGGSPTCGTSRRRCTRRPSTRTSGRAR